MSENSKQETMHKFRSNIIELLAKYPVKKYPLVRLLWDDAAACFPGGPFRWDLAEFYLDLESHKLSAYTTMYPNQFGASPEHWFDLTPAEFHAIAVARDFGPRLRQMETEQDWESLFDDELNAAVSAALAKIREEERLKMAVPIPKSFSDVTPKMNIIHIMLKQYTENWSNAVELTRENGSYALSSQDVHINPILNSNDVRTASPAESVWIEEQVMSAVTAPDRPTSHSGAKMDLILETEQYREAKEHVISLEQYKNLLYDLQKLTRWGSKEAQ